MDERYRYLTGRLEQGRGRHAAFPDEPHVV